MCPGGEGDGDACGGLLAELGSHIVCARTGGWGMGR